MDPAVSEGATRNSVFGPRSPHPSSSGTPHASSLHHSVTVPCRGLNSKERDSPLDPAPTELLAAAAHPSGQLGGGHPKGPGRVPGAHFCSWERHGA